MRNFEGFIRKAVVIVPTDEEFQRRTEKRELKEGKDVPDSAVMEMKGNIWRDLLIYYHIFLYLYSSVCYYHFIILK
jgi:hypothetical protein